MATLTITPQSRTERSINRTLYWTVGVSGVLAVALLFALGNRTAEIKKSSQESVISESAATAGTTADFGGTPIEKK